jgi:effector-binding domain-containing protein
MRSYEVIGRTRARQQTAAVDGTLCVSEIGPWLARTYSTIAQLLARQGCTPAGPPFARYHLREDGRFAVEAGFPIDAPIDAEGDMRPSTLPGGSVAETVHVGPYEDMKLGYNSLFSWVQLQGAEPVGDPWEIYLTDPEAEPDPAEWRTVIMQPYRAMAEHRAEHR